MSESGSDQVFSESVESLMPREGLPREYRMRADRHYVDQLAASSSGQPVRMIPLREFDGVEVSASAALRPLIESIRLHGIVHPLLVRRDENRYKVIAGRKRLIAAATLQLQTVPCLVRDVSDADAAALAAADNILVASLDAPEPQGPDGASLGEAVAAHLSAIEECAQLCDRATGLSRPALDLLKAHAWRGSRLVDAFTLAGHAATLSPRERPLAAIVGDVLDGFDGETRLSGVSIRLEFRDNTSAVGAIDSHVRAGLSGALLAMIPLVEQAARPLILVTVSGGQTSGLTIELVQTCAPISQQIADHFFDDDVSIGRLGGYTATVGALAARALAETHGGEAVFERLPHGSRLAIVMNR